MATGLAETFCHLFFWTVLVTSVSLTHRKMVSFLDGVFWLSDHLRWPSSIVSEGVLLIWKTGGIVWLKFFSGKTLIWLPFLSSSVD